MTDKFKDLRVDEETKIISTVKAKIDTFDVVHQTWYWGGIQAESIIFHNDDVAHLSEEQIKDEVKLCPGLINEGSQITFKRGGKYTFVNFNFIRG